METSILQVDYEENSVLSKCENVMLEAKRVILNEQLDKIANITLAEVNHSRNDIENCLKQCKDSLNWQKETFWQELPSYPNIRVDKSTYNNSHETIVNQPVDLGIDNLILISKNKINLLKCEKGDYLTKKYFSRWKELVKLKKEKHTLLEKKLERKEKLEMFVKKIKKIKKQERNNPKMHAIDNKTPNQEFPTSPHIYKNRYNAQKNIISMQKTKLEQQNKLIEELKMGIIREDLLKSIENTKNDIREIFGSCSNNVKCKVPVVIIQETQQFKISTQKAPKVVQQLEQRSLQRAQRRQVILERKRLMEEARQRMLEEAIENKRALEEEERKKNLEIIKERRKKELEQEKIRQTNKQKYLDSLNKAVNFHNKLIMTQCFKRLSENFRENKHNNLFAKEYYKRKTLKRSISFWCDYVEDTYKVKYEIADAHFTYVVMKKYLKIWRDVHIENVRNMQVAEDLYDFRLTSNTFIYWHRYICSQITLRDRHLKKAENHYKRRLLFHYFYLWRSLPAVIQLEKAKELKKRKWREKVWEIIPDYKPPEDF